MRQRLCRVCRCWHDTDQPWPHNCIGHFGERGPRSDAIPLPQLIRDGMDPLLHHGNGLYYDSKSSFRRATKEGGWVEVGNEKQTDTRWVDPVTADDVGQAINMVNQGYKPEIHGTASEGWSDGA
ncbi:hypothetical protein [Rhizobium sp. BK251]|uniref:hypothetical protein n=1 Tax=Rhizobium sp. BK251 TaxID=2512125 RepID=UPI00104EA410|nr:hypothetical protein [Rhizobium sp. BK251]TCL70543.1 hypothetical protein EV286_107418 [Rhizobium sp. BK251]